ncbi:hypothetical protein J6590_012210 [Homalodisca vitripennis]|nr:hypothetical protein J6590_012210 [Homalodisca vitripennis]
MVVRSSEMAPRDSAGCGRGASGALRTILFRGHSLCGSPSSTLSVIAAARFPSSIHYLSPVYLSSDCTRCPPLALHRFTARVAAARQSTLGSGQCSPTLGSDRTSLASPPTREHAPRHSSRTVLSPVIIATIILTGCLFNYQFTTTRWRLRRFYGPIRPATSESRRCLCDYSCVGVPRISYRLLQPVQGLQTEIFSDYEKMNSYFEQSGFYGSHHHQTAGAGHHHDQTAAAAAAYRFPLGLGMSPYASSQHHHHHSLHQSRPPQDSPYDASVAAACKLYSSSNDTQQSSINYSTSKPDCSKSSSESAHQNGYAAVVAAAAKDVSVWQSTTGGSANSNSLVGPVRPAACTPDSRVGGYSSVGLVGGDPASSPGAAGGGRTSSSASLGGSWNTCSLNTSSSQPAVPTQLHQQPANHTFYPWMAIAGRVVTSARRYDLSLMYMFPVKSTTEHIWWSCHPKTVNSIYI